MVKDDVSLVCAAGAGIFPEHTSTVWAQRDEGHLDDAGNGASTLLCSAPRPLQTVQRDKN